MAPEAVTTGFQEIRSLAGPYEIRRLFSRGFDCQNIHPIHGFGRYIIAVCLLGQLLYSLGIS
jgi:hypothetical protein